MSTRIKLVIVYMIAILSLCGCSSANIENKLSDYMQAVYAPKTMEQFEEAKEDSKEIFEHSVTERFFVSYSDSLSETDLRRVCETYITHGKAENQSDGRERYLVTAYLYAVKGGTPIIKDFTFIVGDSGKIEDFTITDHVE